MDRKKAIEYADIDVFLKCLNKLDGLVPTSVVHTDKPDFIIKCATKTIGVEITRAVYQEVVRAGKLQFSDCPNSCIDLTSLKDHEPRRSNEEIFVTMTNPSGSWRRVEDLMMDWRDKIANTLKSKRRQLNRADFLLFDKNWLLIHDYPPLPKRGSNLDWAERHLYNLFREPSDVPRDFDNVFIQSGPYLFRWDGQGLFLASPKLVESLTLIETGFPT
jgi:hypothetical protein